MFKATIVCTLLYAAVSLTAQRASQDQASGASQGHSKKAKEEVTLRGCVARFSTDYILIQPDVGHSYELEGSRKQKLGPYLGQEVEVTGVEFPSMSNSSDAGFGRLGSPSPVTISVHSIKTLAKRCSIY
jgi:hypothetical protein